MVRPNAPTTKPPKSKRNTATKLATFDPVTFYPALAATEKLKTRNESAVVAAFPNKSISEPHIPPNFDPAVFYSALAAQEKAKLKGASGRHYTYATTTDGSEWWHEENGSFSRGYPIIERPMMKRPLMDVELMQQRKRVRRRLWIIGIFIFLLTLVLVIVIAFCGAHNWFKPQWDS